MPKEQKKESKRMPNNPELIIAFVGAVGVNLSIAEQATTQILKKFKYETEFIKITKDVIPKLYREQSTSVSDKDFTRIDTMMNLGNQARNDFNHNILAKGVAAEISDRREKNKTPRKRTAYLIHSLKHPDEVRTLRSLYPRGFHLIGVHAHPDRRREHLKNSRGMDETQANRLMDRDKKEQEKHGQQLNATFHLADFFVGWGGEESLPTEETNAQTELFPTEGTPNNANRVYVSIERYLDIIFGHPYKTPTFGEYSMFMAYSSSLRSADLSRQVGAVIAKDNEILSSGANDCPKFQGGLYWPIYDPASSSIIDIDKGRDFKRGFDSNKKEQDSLIDEILKDTEMDNLIKDLLEKINTDTSKQQKVDLENNIRSRFEKILQNSPIKNLTEYGRVVHAEMEAILSCTRKGESTKGATIYCTTFPCHNCAKHIIAAGIERVVFVEPYLKSKAIEFHKDSIRINYPQDEEPTSSINTSKTHVSFEPFFGVGPRRFFDLFSMSLGIGEELTRKNRDSGDIVSFEPGIAQPRLRMHEVSYLDLEREAAVFFNSHCKAQVD